jgi:tetratricopeptide (TPR) repeat protein
MSSKLSDALELLRDGDHDGAEALLALARDEARASGETSPAYGLACYEYATLLANLGQLGPAIALVREACAVEGEESTRDRLTYIMQLGELLARAGAVAEAEQPLRESLTGRAEFYGTSHAGYAFGLEPLAEVLALQGELDEAREMIEGAVRIFRDNQHPRIFGALALRAEITKAQDRSAAAFDVASGDAEFFVLLAQATLGRAPVHPIARRAVLRELYDLVCREAGDDHVAALEILAAIANHERALGPRARIKRRIWALERLGEAFYARGDERQALDCLLGVALAESDGGDMQASLASYEKALRRCRHLEDDVLGARTRRNLGLLLATMQERERAEEELRAALELAERSGDRGELGSARAALGIFVQHDGRLDEARPLLAAVVADVHPTHPDAVCARSHLDAIDSSGSCGCGDSEQAFAETLEALMREENLPEGLLDCVEVEDSGNGAHVSLRLDREATPEEAVLLERALRRAEAKIRAAGERARELNLARKERQLH